MGGGLFAIFFLLMVGHAVADYALQSSELSETKRRAKNPGGWWMALGAHALIHGGAVTLVLGSPLLGFFEFVAHFCIDFGRCEGKYSYKVDQFLHVLCKVLWIVFFLLGIHY